MKSNHRAIKAIREEAHASEVISHWARETCADAQAVFQLGAARDKGFRRSQKATFRNNGEAFTYTDVRAKVTVCYGELTDQEGKSGAVEQVRYLLEATGGQWLLWGEDYFSDRDLALKAAGIFCGWAKAELWRGQSAPTTTAKIVQRS